MQSALVVLLTVEAKKHKLWRDSNVGASGMDRTEEFSGQLLSLQKVTKCEGELLFLATDESGH